MTFTIYQALNTVNGKIYVGATGQELAKRKGQHRSKRHHPNTAFHRAIARHGWSSFQWSVLGVCEDKDTANKLEVGFIASLGSMTTGGGGYNQTGGGGGVVGYVFTREDRQKISTALIGKIKSPETCVKLSIANRGKKLSEATKEKLRGQKRSAETCAKIGRASKGRVKSLETRANISAGLKSVWRAGERQGPKITSDDVCDIRLLKDSGLSFSAVAKYYDCTPSAIFYALRRAGV